MGITPDTKKRTEQIEIMEFTQTQDNIFHHLLNKRSKNLLVSATPVFIIVYIIAVNVTAVSRVSMQRTVTSLPAQICVDDVVPVGSAAIRT